MTRLRKARIASYFWVCLWGRLLEETSIWILILSKENCLNQCESAPSNALRAWTEQKCRGRAFSLCLNKRQIFLLPLRVQCLSRFWDLQTPTWTYTIDSPGSEAFGLGLEPNTSFPGSPVKEKIVMLLSLHHYMSQSLIISLFLSLYISYRFCFSGELQLII